MRIIDERYAIKKVRTRYDPEITLYGDKDASMELMMGYDMKQINSTLRWLLFTSISPFFFGGIILFMVNIDNIPKSYFPHWLAWIIIPILAGITGLFFKYYYTINMTMLAEYLKSRDLRKILGKEGFKQ